MEELEYKGISKNFGAVVALKNVSFSIKKGEIRALLGGNGSGKSTLARITAGTVAQDVGEIYFGGKKLDILSPQVSKEYGISVTSQELSLFDSLTVVDNLSLLNVPKKLWIFDDKKTARARAQASLKRVGLEHLVDVPVRELQVNEKYLVELAKALLFDSKVLIVDEITSALRRNEVGLVDKILKEMAYKGCCIIFISHRLNEIFDICKSVSVLRNGGLVNTYEIDNVNEKSLLEDMIGKNLIVDIDNKVQDVARNVNEEEDIVLSVRNLKIPGYEHSDLSFDLHRGEILGISGLQGQGQSDLVRMLYGMRGNVKVDYKGKKVTLSSPEQASRIGIGFISGDRVTEGVFIGRSIEENCVVVNDLVLNNPKLNVNEVLKTNKVKYESANKPIETLSGGNQQRVVVSRWTSVLPDVLLADDLSKGIDVGARFDLHKIMDNIAEQGSGIVFVSSDDEELVVMAKSKSNYSVAILHEGNIVKSLRGREITIENIIAASMPVGNKESEDGNRN